MNKLKIFGGFFIFVLLSITSLFVQAKQIEINLWDQEDPQPAKVLEEWLKEFMKANPEVKAQHTTYQTEDLRQKFITSATAGRAAELVWGPNDMAGTLVTAKLLQPINDFIDVKSIFLPALEAVNLQNKYWGIPVSYGNHLMLMYNKSLIKEAPKTTDELIKLAKAFTNPSKKQYGLVFNNNEPFFYAPIMGGFNAWPLVVDANGKVTITLNSEGNKKGLAFLKSLKFNHQIIPSECDYDCAVGLFQEKKAAMTINGDWFVAQAQKALGNDLGIAPLPIVSETNTPMTPMISGKYLFINRKISPEKLVVVKKLVAFLMTQQKQVEVAERLNRIPALISAQNDPKTKNNALIQLLLSAAKNAKAMPPQVEIRAAWDGMRPVLQQVMADKTQPEKAAEEMQKLAEQKLKALSK